MGKLQNQLITGKKVNRPSDDPVTVMKGMGYRREVDKVLQFQRNLGEANNWLDSSDDALDHVGSALHRANELMVNISTDTLTQEDREAIIAEVKELQKTIQDLANTKVGDKYIFSGTKTGTPLFNGGYPPIADFIDPNDPTNTKLDPNNAFNKDVSIEVFDGIPIQVNTSSGKMFAEIDAEFDKIIKAVEDKDTDLDQYITSTQKHMDDVLAARADIGARQNRVEMMGHRLDAHEGISKKQMSENEDVEYEQAITDMLTEEAIHRAALSVGARIIQPSLVDFLR